jgi:tetratricopeptide (TPR) repeat protein
MLGFVASSQGDDERARVYHSESLALSRELENTGGIAYGLTNLGWLARLQGDYERAGALYSEALALARELNDRLMIAIQLRQMGDLALAQDDLSTAQTRYSEATALARELNLPSLAWYISQRWEVACRQGDYETATALHQESLALWQGRDEKGGIAMAQYQLGTVAQQQGDYPSARAHHAQSLALWQEVGDDHGVAECLEQLAAIAQAEGQPLKAAGIFGAAAPLRVRNGMPLWPVERVNHDQQAAALRSALRATLGEAAFAAAGAAGRALSLEEAIGYALDASST